MNRGLNGFDGVGARLGVYRAPYAPLVSFGTAKEYTVAHPFAGVPVVALVMLRCSADESPFIKGDETNYVCTDSTSTTNGLRLVYRPFALKFLFKTVGFSLKGTGGSTFSITPAKWDLGFMVIA
jgi:hypothetical protein